MSGQVSQVRTASDAAYGARADCAHDTGKASDVLACPGHGQNTESDPALQILSKMYHEGHISRSDYNQVKASMLARKSGQPQAEGASSASDQKINESLTDNAVQTMGNSKKKKGSGSWFEALAEALGKALDAQAAKVEALASQITDANAKDKPSTMTQLQTESQRMSFMMNAVDQILKTIGEALATMAKKN